MAIETETKIVGVDNGIKRTKATSAPTLAIQALGKGTNCASAYADDDATVKIPAGTFCIFVNMEAESEYETKGGRKYISKVNGQKSIGEAQYNLGFFLTEASTRNSLD